MKTDLIDVTLVDIVGRSPLNARPDDPNDDVSGLAATIEAVGLLQRISLTRAPDGGFEVVAGWRRVKALRHLHDIGHFHDDENIPAALLEGTPDELVAASIAENTERRMLRAPEEAEAFAMLASRGREPEDIARDFGVTVRHVRGRLKLASLCLQAMALWKADKFTLECARALCALDHDRQAALITEANGAPSLYKIRAAFEFGKVRGDDPRATYIGRDAYAAAGGQIEEYLFGEFDFFLDEDLLERLARAKMQTEGEAICDVEGWGSLVIDPEWNVAQSYAADKRRDLLDQETERLAAINEERDAIWNAEDYDENEPETKARLAALDLEEEVIETRGLLRAIAQGERAEMALFVSLDDNGRLEVQRAMTAKAPIEKPAKGASGAAAGDSAEHIGSAAQQEQTQTGSEHQETQARETLEAAMREAVRMRPDLALAFLVASLAQQSSDVLQIETDQFYPWENDLVCELVRAANIGEALLIAVNAPQGDVLVALTDFVGYAVNISGADSETISRAWQAAALRGAAVREHMVDAFNPNRWFAKA
ncbi:MAG: ParB/RepB/Spo0J family partition protein, partial [Beijerinckiaceae bacterium]|nr:ParB/RepB/Spo0J family partition protein [Beijerinckiaceae bacterium]